jgi:hypothetical protein
MTLRERDRARAVELPPRWPALLTLDQAQDVARATMVCDTCGWAVREAEPCPEQEYLLGCIHYVRREER